jgi:hypothetical protein
VPFQELVNVVRHHAAGGERLAEALQQLQAAGTGQPFQMNVALGPWTAQQAQQLERFVGGAALRPMQAGSFELSEALRRRLQAESSSGLAAGASPGGASWQQAPGQPPPGFWFAVNAELIIYGATEPDAAVTIDGQPITLRPDGTFAFHYLFPDGQYRLPLVAVSAQGDDQRAVQLQFERQTATHGEVGQVRPPEHRAAPAK